MEFEFEIPGVQELNHALKLLPEDIAKKVVRQAVAAGARVIRDAAKELAPYDPSRTAGVHLRDGIVVKRKKNTNDIMIIGTQTRGSKAVPYAHLLEFGTVKMSARPFLAPAAAMMQQKAIGKMFNNLSNGILRESKKLAGVKPKKRKPKR